MKTEQEIRDEIIATKNTIKNYRKAFKNSKINKGVLQTQIADCTVTIDTLKWVLGENERYD